MGNDVERLSEFFDKFNREPGPTENITPERVKTLWGETAQTGHAFEPCLRDGEPRHNFTCALLCTTCGLPADKH